MPRPRRTPTGDAPAGTAPKSKRASQEAKAANCHAGHRSRMRERFRIHGLDGFQDHELLELLLYYTRPQGDTNATAHLLLDTFGSLRGVLEADFDQLVGVKGIGETGATLISLIVPLVRRYELACASQMRIESLEDLKHYCVEMVKGQPYECFYLLGLGVDHRVLGHRLIATGSLTDLSFSPRVVLEAVLQFNAYGVVFCHNHPTGRCEPSIEDIQTTQQYDEILRQFDIQLEDHIIVADDGSYSMAQHQDLPRWKHETQSSKKKK